KIEKVNVPSDFMIQEARQQRFMNDIASRLSHDHLPAYRKIIEEFLQQNPEASAVDVSAALALLLNKDKPWKRESLPQQTVVRKTRESRDDRGGRGDRDNHYDRGAKKTSRPQRVV